MSRQRLVVVFACCVLGGSLFAVQGCGTASSTWEAFQEDGDKPGTAIVLHAVNGIVLAGEVYMLDPDHPKELRSGIGYPIQGLCHSGNTVSGEVVVVDRAEASYRSRHEFRLVLSKPLQGTGPISTIPGPDDWNHEGWIFVRRGDQACDE